MKKRGRPRKKPVENVEVVETPAPSVVVKKKIKINRTRISESSKSSKSSGDSDATEVYSVSDDDHDDEDFQVEKKPRSTKTPAKKKVQRKSVVAAPIRVHHDLSENSDDNLTYSRRSILMKPKRRQKSSSSSSSLFTDEKTSPSRRGKTKKKVKKSIEDSSDEKTDVEQLDEKVLIEKTDRRMLKDEDLTQMTQKALEDERQRVQRIQQRQTQMTQDVEIENPIEKINENIESKLVFESDTKTNKPLISVHPELVAKMKPHQIDGTIFLWDNVYESLGQIRKDNSGTGCILAHHMGLGKTFQLISFLHTVFKHADLTKTRTCLILCPVNVISNWAAEFSYWLSGLRPTIRVHQFSHYKTRSARLERLNKWQDKGGVMLMGYEIYRRMTNDKHYHRHVSNPGPDLVVCDEGHVLKNANAGISKALNQIRTKRRIILTGTPLQNNLKEYYFMVHFVKPHLLGTFREFKNQFIDPIRAGQHKDSNVYAVQLMKRRAFALHERLKHCTHRRDFNVLRKYLPEKYEFVIKIYMGDLQKQLYSKYLEIQNIDPEACFNTARLFADYQYLMKIWTHPWLLRPHFIDRWKKKQRKEGGDESEKIDPFFNDVTGQSDEENTTVEEEKPKKITKKTTKNSSLKKMDGRKGRKNENQNDSNDNEDDDGNCSSNSSSSTSEFLSLFNNTSWKQNSSSSISKTSNSSSNNFDLCQQAMREEWWYQFFDDSTEFKLDLSGKITFLKTLLEQCEQIGDKVLLFSRSLFSLTYLEQFLKFWDSNATGKKIQTDDFDAKVKANGRWKFGIDYFRIDGSTDINTRTNYITKFNDPGNIRSRLFIVSTMAGGIGINLTGSNRVVIFDCSWNPSSDLQALFRSYRLGQKKTTYVYRLLSKGTMEEKIYFRQVNKQAMAQRVVDAQQLARHFTESELLELYSFKPEEYEAPESTSKYHANDFILENCLKMHPKLIQNVLAHDSLLENHVEEQLTREEKYFAIKELEREERQAEYQTAVAKSLAAMGCHSNNNNNNNIHSTKNLNHQRTEKESTDSKTERKVISLGPLNSYNPYQPAPPMCAQARASISTGQEALGLERLTELLFPKDAAPLPPGKGADLPPLKDITDMPVSKEEIADLDLDEDDFDLRTKREKQKALLKEQRAYYKLYNEKKKLLRAPKAPRLPKKAKEQPNVSTSVVFNPYQVMPVTMNPFDMPPEMQKLPE